MRLPVKSDAGGAGKNPPGLNSLCFFLKIAPGVSPHRLPGVDQAFTGNFLGGSTAPQRTHCSGLRECLLSGTAPPALLARAGRQRPGDLVSPIGVVSGALPHGPPVAAQWELGGRKKANF